MTTIVNSPAPVNDNTGNSGLFIGIFGLIVLGLLFFYFGLPAIRRIGTPQINIPAPVINMPDEIDVNVNQTP
jgi:hypothetical protein